jgi:hypothetical protein
MSTARSRTAPIAAPASPVFEDILVYLDDSAASANALAYADALAPEGNVAALMYGMIPSYTASEFGAEAWLIAQREAELNAGKYEAERFEGLGGKVEMGAGFLGSLFTGGDSPLDEARQNAARRKLLASEIATAEATSSAIKLEIQLTGDAADKATIGPIKAKGAPVAPSVSRGKTGSQR